MTKPSNAKWNCSLFCVWFVRMHHTLVHLPPSTLLPVFSSLIIHFTFSAFCIRGARGSTWGQPLQAVAPPSGPGVPMLQMHLHVLQRPGPAAAPAEARWDQALPVPALLLRQQSTEPAGGASTPWAQGQSESTTDDVFCSYISNETDWEPSHVKCR